MKRIELMDMKMKYRTKTWLSKVTKLLGDCLFDCCFAFLLFTARCTLVQSAVLRSHVVCPSAVCNVGEL